MLPEKGPSDAAVANNVFDAMWAYKKKRIWCLWQDRLSSAIEHLINPLEFRGKYSATSNNMKLEPAQAPPSSLYQM